MDLLAAQIEIAILQADFLGILLLAERPASAARPPRIAPLPRLRETSISPVGRLGLTVSVERATTSPSIVTTDSDADPVEQS